ncbi:hypothetical protein SB767_28440, partial [Bacillus sp. SIMBA_069]
AVLLHANDTSRDTVVLLENHAPAPPTRLRLPGEFAGAAVFDVYELADDDEWPEQAVYWHVEIIPRTTADLT